MAVLTIRERFSGGFEGELEAPRARAAIGSGEGRLAPYDMLLGALASCYYSTFLDVIGKKRLRLAGAEIEASGEKRQEIPATLKWVTLRLSLIGAERSPVADAGYREAAELAGKYCSIYQTLSRVAEMKTELEFQD
jgi:putative redox protein